MTLEEKIKNWNGKSAADIGSIFDEYKNSSSFLENLLKFSHHTELQRGSTWLLKKHLETDGDFSSSQVNEFYRAIPKLEFWESKIHALQSIPHFGISSKHQQTAEEFLRDCLGEKVIFVRAWAYSGFYELAKTFPEYQEEARVLLNFALENEPASVKARIRKLVQAGF